MKRTASHEPAASFAVPFIALLMALSNSDILGYILRTTPAGQESICALHFMMSVSRSWLAAAREVLADEQWLVPFVQAAERFLRRDRLLCAHSAGENNIDLSFRKIHAPLLGISMYRSHVGVQEAGCKVLGTIASIKYKGAMAVVGGIRTVVKAMTIHKGDVNVQAAGCEALWKIADSNYKRMAVVRARGIGMVVSATTACTWNENVQIWGLIAMSRLSTVDGFNADMVSAGAIPVVVAAMVAHIDNKELQAMGVSMLCRLQKTLPTTRQLSAQGALI